MRKISPKAAPDARRNGPLAVRNQNAAPSAVPAPIKIRNCPRPT